MSNYSGFSSGPRGPSRRAGKSTVVQYGIGAPHPDPASPQSNTGQVNILAEEITKLRAQGMTWAQIEVETGISAAECATIASNYLRSSYTGTSVESARQLQIMRLEMLMQMLYKQVEDGDILSQGRQTTNLISTINQVTELLDLRKDRLRDEQLKLNQEQGQLLLRILQDVQNRVIEDVLKLLTAESIYNATTGQREVLNLATLRAKLERDWGGWFAQAADDTLSDVTGDRQDAVVPSVPQSRIVRGELNGS